MESQIVCFIADDMFDNTIEYILQLLNRRLSTHYVSFRMREEYYRPSIPDEHWVQVMHDITFFQLFRLKKETFSKLLDMVVVNDQFCLIKKRYIGGRHPVPPEKALLVFLWYIAHPDSLHSISYRFDLVPSTVMNIVNSCLYILVHMKNKIICWPKTSEEFEHLENGFTTYPGVIGAIDGSHINIKVPSSQHDSYVDRYMQHSINLMAICSASHILTYVFVGFPGSAHDSRVFLNSQFFRNIESYGPSIYFPADKHLLGDSAFPIKPWLMTPYKQNNNLTREQKYHNQCLSSSRVVIENTFGILKGRFRKLQFINTYCVAKAIEIVTAACVIHNFCYLNNDEWEEDICVLEERNFDQENQHNNDRELGKLKRDRIAHELYHNNQIN
ncbi:putative nuclease HARBI1 [Coccinella septempunctata]|uniref:putative nuclease HARBI1 n=1 Tax=Coccinella septempunctata TaxID=41139 RepID=UPI001D098D5B|nr:putative nuclease HARBI1 [Coccinella septempunctata]